MGEACSAPHTRAASVDLPGARPGAGRGIVILAEALNLRLDARGDFCLSPLTPARPPGLSARAATAPAALPALPLPPSEPLFLEPAGPPQEEEEDDEEQAPPPPQQQQQQQQQEEDERAPLGTVSTPPGPPHQQPTHAPDDFTGGLLPASSAPSAAGPQGACSSSAGRLAAESAQGVASPALLLLPHLRHVLLDHPMDDAGLELCELLRRTGMCVAHVEEDGLDWLGGGDEGAEGDEGEEEKEEREATCVCPVCLGHC